MEVSFYVQFLWIEPAPREAEVFFTVYVSAEASQFDCEGVVEGYGAVVRTEASFADGDFGLYLFACMSVYVFVYVQFYRMPGAEV